VRGHQPRTETAALRKRLAGEKLARVSLPVADAALVVAGIAGDVIERAACGNVPAFLADDERKLALVIEVVADARLHHRLKMPDLTAGEAGEQCGLLGDGPSGLRDVVAIIEADADDLAGIRDHGRESNRLEGMIRRGGAGQFRGVSQSAGLEQPAQRRTAFA